MTTSTPIADVDPDRPPDMESETSILYILSDAEIKAGFQNSLDLAGCSWEELDAQARSGRFESETARLAWFAASSFVNDL